MKTFQKFALNEGLIQIPPKIYKQFENALFTFAFSHMIAETELDFAKAVKNVAKKYGNMIIVMDLCITTELISEIMRWMPILIIHKPSELIDKVNYNLEIIFINDGSTDDSKNIISELIH